MKFALIGLQSFHIELVCKGKKGNKSSHFICMNTYISKTIRATVTKFKDNM